MKNILNIALNDLRVYFSERSNIFSLVGLPLILTFILGVAGGTGGGTTGLGVDWIDQDNSPQSAQLLSDLRANNATLYFCPMDDSETLDCRLGEDKTLTVEQARLRVQENDTNAMIIIPQDFGANLEALQPVELTYASLSDLTSGDPVIASLQAVVQKLNTATVSAKVAVSVGQSFPSGSIFADDSDQADFAKGVLDKARSYEANTPLTIDYTLTQLNPNGNPNSLGFGQSIPGMGSMFVMFTVFGGITILIKERKQWTLQRLVVLPLRRSEILGGKVLFYFTLGFMQYLVVFAVAIFTGTYLGSDIVALVALMVAFTLCCTGLALFLATLIKTQQQADGVTLLIAMTLAPLGGAWWPLEIVPQWMQLVGRISPVSWAMEGYRSLIFFNGNLGTVAIDIVVLLAIGAVLFALGVRGFEYE